MLGRQTAMELRRSGFVGTRDNAARFRVWAPKARRASIVLVDGSERQTIELEADGAGYFEHDFDEIAEGQHYAIRLDDGQERPDPCALWQPGSVHGPSAVYRPERFEWTDSGWEGVRQQDLVVYELHIGTFTERGTFDAAIERLPELRELGVSAIEIMPVAQFPGTRNWGYDGVLPYATQNSYGGPEGLQRLVDACHANGLAAILDVVYNHFGPEGNYLGEFGPYLTDAYKTPWGSAVNYDGRGCDGVRRYVLDNVRMWLEDFHFDGLRLDAVHAIFDFGPKHILREVQEVVDEVSDRSGVPRLIVAESDMNDPRLLLPAERGGYGLAAQWSDDFHHSVHSVLTGETQGYYEDFGTAQHLTEVMETPFLYDGRYSAHRGRSHGAPAVGLSGERFVVSIQNHDQVGNRAQGDRFGSLLSPPAQRLAASLLLLSPHVPMIFMGDEYGEKNPFQFFCSFCDEQLIEAVRKGRTAEFAAFNWQGDVPDPHSEKTFANSRLSWSWPEGSVHGGIRQLYRDLLAARKQWPAMKDFVNRRAQLLYAQTGAGVLELTRGASDGHESLTAYFNLTEETQSLGELQSADANRGMKCLFSSEGTRYQGQRSDWNRIGELLPHECVVFGPGGWHSFGG
jgi:maltooligosyltrehalose trehalohydrolase